jgi:DNA-binding NarL/FixJ family response regulator
VHHDNSRLNLRNDCLVNFAGSDEQGAFLMRIILADHNRKALWALRMLLDEEPGMEVVGEATNADKLQKVAEKNRADLILVDRRLPGSEIEVLIPGLHALEPKLIVVVMGSNYEDSKLVLRAGADAFVSKGEQPDWLLETLRRYAKRTINASELE